MTAGEQFSLIPEFEKADLKARSEAQAEAAQDREEEEKKIQETLNRGVWEAELKALDDEKRAEEIAACPSNRLCCSASSGEPASAPPDVARPSCCSICAAKPRPFWDERFCANC